MRVNKDNIFLFDGIGAMLSALSNGLVLPLLSDFLSISKNTFYFLGLLGLLYAIYSLSVHFFVRSFSLGLLLTIVVANLFYCLVLVGAGLISSSITGFGWSVLLGEAIIILVVVSIELRFTIAERRKI